MNNLDKLGEKLKGRITALQTTTKTVKDGIGSEERSISTDFAPIWDAFEDAKKNKVAIIINGDASSLDSCGRG